MVAVRRGRALVKAAADLARRASAMRPEWQWYDESGDIDEW
jgi:hypothetical protein